MIDCNGEEVNVFMKNILNWIWISRWRRQTRLRQVGTAGGLRGDVYYFAPCGKKLRTYPEVTRVSIAYWVLHDTQQNIASTWQFCLV